MNNHLPGLGALKGFEAAARHLSFTRAAAELNVTPAAVSHLVRELEDQLAVPLFTRSSRVVRLTHAGEILQDAVAEALDGIARAVKRLKDLDRGRRLNVTAGPSFAAKWLVPRVDRFMIQHRAVDVRIDVSQRPPDFAREDVDIAIIFGKGNYPGLSAHQLFEETIFPVCSPKLLKGPRPLRRLRDLLNHTLIHVDWEAQGETWPNWKMWMLAAGIDDIDATRGMTFNQEVLAIQAAIDGQGVALCDSTLVADDLASRRLVRPFEVTLPGTAHFAYFVVYDEKRGEEPLIKSFRDWILTEAAATKVVGRDGRVAKPRRARSGKPPAKLLARPLARQAT